jgi:hypothetical protein
MLIIIHTSFAFCPLLKATEYVLNSAGVGLHFGMGLGLFCDVHNGFSYQVEVEGESHSGCG